MSLNKIKASRVWLGLVCVMISGSAWAAGEASHPGNPSDQANAGLLVADRGGNNILNQNDGLFYADLAAAVAAADPGDTLVVQNSYSEGQVTIDKNLTIEGATGSEVISAGVSTGDTGDNRGWFVIETGASVSFSGLGFDGSGQDIFQAIRAKGEVSVDDVDFDNIVFQTLSGETGFGIVGFNAGGARGSSAQVTVTDATFEGIGKSAVFIFDTDGSVDGSIFTGRGGNFIDYGVELGNGATVSIDDSIFVGATGSGFESAGVYASSEFGGGNVATLTSNWFQGNDNAVLAEGAGSEANGSFNTFIDNGEGVASDDSGNLPNNFWGCNAGPNTADCDSADGSTSPWLVASGSISTQDIVFGEVGTFTVSLNTNSDNQNTSGSGTIIDGVPVDFDGNGLVNFANSPVGTTAGSASSDFTTASYNQTDVVCATIGNETICFPVSTLSSRVPTLGEWGMIAFVCLLAAAGVAMMRRTRTA